MIREAWKSAAHEQQAQLPLPDVLRVLAELVAWVALPWALGRISLWLAPLALLVLIGLPAVLATPGTTASRTSRCRSRVGAPSAWS
ncbi:hypothetical protein [Kitasatospora acidiphila]|uniref:hypothetical protein n=1 Tax=Kitasatospora acidiphila TaxID=2567942 RepID=UPI001E3ABF9B|nr:hypothetical protein [Kitasatospora acidiphila]